MFVLESHGSFENTERFLKRMSKGDIFEALSQFGQLGAAALSSATPQRSGLAASSWSFEVEAGPGSYSIFWTNDNIENGHHVAVMIQLGHGTGTGGYVQGRDYINPAIRPIFDQIADSVWKVVTSA